MTTPPMHVVTPQFVQEFVFGPLELKGLTLTKVFVSPYDYADFRKFGRGSLTLNTDPGLMKRGVMGYLFNVEICVQNGVTTTGVVCVEDSNYIRHMMCLRCAEFFEGNVCSSNSCTVACVHES